MLMQCKYKYIYYYYYLLYNLLILNQLYKNLDIITNKATSEEMKNIPHHLIGYLDSTYIKHNVIDYRNKAVELIDNLLQNDIIPILGLLYTLFYVIIKVLNDIFII